MKSYESGADLAVHIEKTSQLFIHEFEDISKEDWDSFVEGVDRTPRQMIAYQLGWMDLLLGWERDEQAGKDVATPAEGYKWNQLGRLYESFYKRWETATAEELTQQFHSLVIQVMQLVHALSKEELFQPHQRAWASSTPSAWPVWKWIHINTVAPFTSFRSQIRKWKKAVVSAEKPLVWLHLRLRKVAHLLSTTYTRIRTIMLTTIIVYIVPICTCLPKK